MHVTLRHPLRRPHEQHMRRRRRPAGELDPTLQDRQLVGNRRIGHEGVRQIGQSGRSVCLPGLECRLRRLHQESATIGRGRRQLARPLERRRSHRVATASPGQLRRMPQIARNVLVRTDSGCRQMPRSPRGMVLAYEDPR